MPPARTVTAIFSLLLLVAALAPGLCLARVELRTGHRAFRSRGIENFRLSGDVLYAKAREGGTAFVVLFSDLPLSVEAAENATAELVPGWDGTLGYSLYGLKLTAARAGTIVVRLRSATVPSRPIRTRPEELEAFARKFRARPSRFPDGVAGFLKWQKRYRSNLVRWLMNGGFPPRVPLEPVILQTREYDKFILRRVKYRSREDRFNTALLSLPKDRTGRVPLLLALHGHESKWGDADEAAFRYGHPDDFCAYFAERGWAVLFPATLDHHLQHPGWTLHGEWTWDALMVLDYAMSLPEIDTSRVAVCGLSTGGHLAMYVLALDHRVKAGVVGCILSTWHHYRSCLPMPPGCDCGIISQLGDRLEQCDLAALVAPKPVQYQHGRKDASFCPGASEKYVDLKWVWCTMPAEEYDLLFGEVKRAYRILGQPSRVTTFIHDMDHRVDNEAAYEWLCTQLQVGPSQ